MSNSANKLVPELNAPAGATNDSSGGMLYLRMLLGDVPFVEVSFKACGGNDLISFDCLDFVTALDLRLKSTL